MKTTIHLDNKKVSLKAMIEKIGKVRMERYMKEAKEGFMMDPLEEQSWYLGSLGIMVIEFT